MNSEISKTPKWHIHYQSIPHGARYSIPSPTGPGIAYHSISHGARYSSFMTPPCWLVNMRYVEMKGAELTYLVLPRGFWPHLYICVSQVIALSYQLQCLIAVCNSDQLVWKWLQLIGILFGNCFVWLKITINYYFEEIISF